MAVEKGPKLDWSVLAGADLSAAQFQFVKFSGTASEDTVVPITAATDKPLGILGNNPALGETADITISGIAKALCGGTIARDDFVGTDATGNAVKITPATDTTKYVCGRALEAGVAGQIISIAISTAAAYLAK